MKEFMRHTILLTDGVDFYDYALLSSCDLMARLARARAEAFADLDVAIVRVRNRSVRRCFLLGDDPVTVLAGAIPCGPASG